MTSTQHAGVRAADTSTHTSTPVRLPQLDGRPFLSEGGLETDRVPAIAVVGGCCGTDLAHLRAIAAAMVPVAT